MTIKSKRTIGNKINRAMKDVDLTQKQLAKKLGLKQHQTSYWITEKLNPKLNSLRKIGEATGKDIGYFFYENKSINQWASNNKGEVKQVINHCEVEFFKTTLKMIEAKLDLIIQLNKAGK